MKQRTISANLDFYSLNIIRTKSIFFRKCFVTYAMKICAKELLLNFFYVVLCFHFLFKHVENLIRHLLCLFIAYLIKYKGIK